MLVPVRFGAASLVVGAPVFNAFAKFVLRTMWQVMPRRRQKILNFFCFGQSDFLEKCNRGAAMKQPQPHPEIKDRRVLPRPCEKDSSKLVHALSRQESDRLSQQLLANYQATRQTKSL